MFQCYCLMCKVHLKSINGMNQISISLSSLCSLCCICPYYEQFKKTEIHCAALRAVRVIEITPVRAMLQQKKARECSLMSIPP